MYIKLEFTRPWRVFQGGEVYHFISQDKSSEAAVAMSKADVLVMAEGKVDNIVDMMIPVGGNFIADFSNDSVVFRLRGFWDARCETFVPYDAAGVITILYTDLETYNESEDADDDIWEHIADITRHEFKTEGE